MKDKNNPKHRDSLGNWLYEYNKVVYDNVKKKVIITCKIHGDFLQTPDNHLQGQGCKDCSKISTANKQSKTTDDFVKEAKDTHDDLYSYEKSKYVNSKVKVKITCSVHGDFLQLPNSHVSGAGCPTCSGNIRSNTEDFIVKATNIHNGLYGYDRVNYINNSTKVNIKCPIHGYFEQSPATHILGQGCNTCAKLLKGWSKNHFIDACNRNNKGLGILYVIRCFNDNESFYKIGITSKSVKARYASNYHMPYNYEELYIIQDEPSIIYDLENKLILQSAIYKYEPLIFFEGKTECINDLSLIEEQLKIT